MVARRARAAQVRVDGAANGRPRPVILWIALAGGYFAVGATLQELPDQLTTQHGAGPALVAWVASAPFALSALARIWAGRISDRGWADVVVIDGAALVLLGVVLQLSDWSVCVIVLARGLMGLGQGMMSAGALPWVVAAGRRDRRGRTAARFGLSMWSGLAAGPVAASATAQWSPGLRLPVLAVGGGIGLVCAIAGRDGRGSRGSLRGVARRGTHRRTPGVTAVSAYLGLMSFAYGTVVGLLVLYMTARGFAPDGCLGAFAGGFVVVRLCAGPQIDRRGARRVGAVCASTVACALAVLPIAPTTAVALALVATAGAGVGLAYPCAVTIAFTASSGARAQTVSAVTSSWDVGLVTGGIVSGLVVGEAGYGTAFVLAAAVAAGALYAVLRSQPPRRIGSPRCGERRVLRRRAGVRERWTGAGDLAGSRGAGLQRGDRC
jgi:MFS family permease